MPISVPSRGLALLAVASIALSGCGGTLGRANGMLPPEVAHTLAPRGKAAFSVKLLVPKSVGAESLEIVLVPAAGGTAYTVDANLSPALNASCAGTPLLCNLKLKVLAGNYVATVSAFAGSLVKGKPSGARLSSAAAVPIDVVNLGSVGISLGGAVKAVAFLPVPSPTMTGNPKSGYTLSKCFVAQKVSVFGLDVNGNLILGPKSPTPSLASNDAHVAIATPAPHTPNTFTLTRSSIPVANSVVQLKASAKPVKGSAASLTIPIAIGAEICGVITEYASGVTGTPKGIAAGPDGNLWFTEWPSKIGRITTDGVITEYSLGLTAASYPDLITQGADGALWFAECGADKIGRITTGGVITEFAVKSTGSAPFGITPGPDKNLWFTENDMYNGNKIGVMTTTGSVIEYSQGITSASQPYGITAGADHRLWFSESEAPQIGAITTDGVVTEYSAGLYGAPDTIASGPDGNLWFTEVSGERIGKITTAGVVTEYTSGLSTGVNPFGITNGPDGNLWFTELEDRVGKITTAGAITEYSTGITTGAGPYEIVAGSDGNLWFTEASAGRIGRLQ